MPLCVQELDKRGMHDPGADRRRGDQPPLRPPRAVRRRRARVRARRVLLQGRVRGAGDDGRAAGRADRREAFDREAARRGAQRRVPAHERRQGRSRRRSTAASAATCRATTPIPRRRSSARACCADIPLDEVFDLLDLDELYPPAVGRARLGRAVRARRCARSSSRRSRGCKAEAQGATAGCKPQAVYGYFPVQIARQRRDRLRSRRRTTATAARCVEIARFHFPRQEGRERLCLADYFRSVESATSTSWRSRS